nr:MAG TPA: hypothetical protein [Caudoviricetes sp.]
MIALAIVFYIKLLRCVNFRVIVSLKEVILWRFTKESSSSEGSSV